MLRLDFRMPVFHRKRLGPLQRGQGFLRKLIHIHHRRFPL